MVYTVRTQTLKGLYHRSLFSCLFTIKLTRYLMNKVHTESTKLYFFQDHYIIIERDFNTTPHNLEWSKPITQWKFPLMIKSQHWNVYRVFRDCRICQNKSANALALCHPPSASFCSVLAGQWSSRIFTHDKYNILSDILIEFEVKLGIIIEKYAKNWSFPLH